MYNQKYASLYLDIHNTWRKLDYQYYWGEALDFRFFIVSKLIKESCNRVLDIGCSIGINLFYVPAKERIGIDVDMKCLKLGKKGFPDIEFIAASAVNLPFKDEVLDEVVCIHTLDEYSIDQKKACNEIMRVSTKKGRFFGSGNWYDLKFKPKGTPKDKLEKTFGSWIKILGENFSLTTKGYRRPNMRSLTSKIKRRVFTKIPHPMSKIVKLDYWFFKDYKENDSLLKNEPYIVIGNKIDR